MTTYVRGNLFRLMVTMLVQIGGRGLGIVDWAGWDAL